MVHVMVLAVLEHRARVAAVARGPAQEVVSSKPQPNVRELVLVAVRWKSVMGQAHLGRLVLLRFHLAFA